MRISLLEGHLSAMAEFVDKQSRFWNPDDPRAELFHYTSPDGFIGIVSQKTLWASDMLSLNDASEVRYPQRLIGEVLDEYASQIPARYKEQFEIQLTDYMFRLYTPFIACFCENGDLLSQWRAYGSEGEGFAVGLSVPWLLGLEKGRFRLQRVIYDRAQQTDLVLMFLETARSLLAESRLSEEELTAFWKGAAASLAPWVVMFKDPGFREEQEWRIVNVDPPKLGMQFRRAGHRIVPYIRIPLASPSAITRVIRGPYFANTDKRGAYLMLVTSGFIAGANIDDSKMPLRR